MTDQATARLPDVRAPAGARTARRLKSEDRQREIVAAVLALAREIGPEAITTHAIAERVGVTQGAIFRHFPDKASIWIAVLTWVQASLDAAYDAAIARDGTPLERIERAFLAHAAFVAAHPGVPRVVFHELQYPGDSAVRTRVREMMTGYRRRVAQLFAQASAGGELARCLDTTTATMLFIGAMQGLVMQSSIAGDERAMLRNAKAVFALMLDGWRGKGAS